MEETLGVFLGYAINISILVGFCMSLYVIKKIGNGVLNIAVIPFSLGILLIGVSNFFIFLSKNGFYDLSITSLHMWWHLIAVIGFISIIFGGVRIKNASNMNGSITFGKSDVLTLGVMALAVIAIFIAAQPLEKSFGQALQGSVFENFGLHHLIAFIFAFIAGFYLIHIRKQAGNLVVSISFVAGFLFLLGGQHIWEFLTESVKMIQINEEAIELVEQFLVFPAMILFIISQFRIIKFIKG